MRTAMLYIANRISGDMSSYVAVAEAAITAIRNYTGSIDEADYEFRNALFRQYVNCAKFKAAAVVLSGLNLESTSRRYTAFEKADLYVTCAESCLSGGEAVDAENFVKRASEHMNEADQEIRAGGEGHTSQASALDLRYRVCYAQVLDANRKFADAATRYYQVSSIENSEADPDDLLVLLGKAVTCAVLAKAGPPRTRLLALLSKDARLPLLESVPSFSQHATVLHKMDQEQLLKIEELKIFQESLQPHQKAVTEGGFTVVEKAVIEHNLQAASKIYNNIRISELSKLLNMDVNNAEKLVAKMISEDRLQGVLDQTEGLLLFSEEDEIYTWNDNVKSICSDLTDVMQTVQEMYPGSFFEANE